MMDEGADFDDCTECEYDSYTSVFMVFKVYIMLNRTQYALCKVVESSTYAEIFQVHKTIY